MEATRQIEAKIGTVKAAIERVEAGDEELAALRRRAWMRRINRGAVWTGTVGAAGALREAVRESPGITAAVGGVTVALGAGVAALAIGIGGNQQPPTAGPRPSISAPVPQPSTPPTTGQRPQPRRPRPEQPPRVVALPIVITPPAVKPALGLDGPPKAPSPSPAQPAPPSEFQVPPTATKVRPTCVANLRVITIDVRLLCR